MQDVDAINLALLILRASIGLMLAAHGYNKFFGGGRIPGTAGWFESIGVRPGKLNAVMAASTEMGAGLLLALGLLTPFSAAGVIGVMGVAFAVEHRTKGFFIIKEGWEYVAIIALMALVAATLGPGEWSLDHALEIDDNLSGWGGFLIALIGGVGASVAQLSLFWRPGSVGSGD